MTDKQLLTPPPELVREWNQEATGTHFEPYGYSEFIATRAARWGADQELEACVNWLIENQNPRWAHVLRAARRPKPPSLKEQALKALKVLPTPDGQVTLDITDLNTIRRALEALND